MDDLIEKYQIYFFNADLLGYYIDDSTTDNTTCLMKIYA